MASNKAAFIENALDNIDKGYWMKWDDAILVKPGDAIKMRERRLGEDNQLHDFDVEYIVSEVGVRDTEFGFKEVHIVASVRRDGKKAGGMAGVIGVNVFDRRMAGKDPVTLFASDEVIFDTYDDRYRLSFFKDGHWKSEVVMDKNGHVAYSSADDDSI